jgi:hypothetical protein
MLEKAQAALSRNLARLYEMGKWRGNKERRCEGL